MSVDQEPRSRRLPGDPVGKACEVTALTSGLLMLAAYLGGDPFEPKTVPAEIGIAMWVLAPPLLGGFVGGFLGVRVRRVLPPMVLSRVCADAVLIMSFPWRGDFRLGFALLSMLLVYPLGAASVTAGRLLARRRGIPMPAIPVEGGRRGFTTGNRWVDGVIRALLATVIALVILILIGTCIAGGFVCD